MAPDDVVIHPTATVDSRAKIGAGSRIWINVQVREGARIGERCILSKDVYIDHGVTIGSGCKVQNGVSLYHGLTVGDDVFIGPNACFTNDKVPRADNANWSVTPTQIEDGASIGANATIVCGVVVGKRAMVAAGAVVTRDVPPYTLVMGNPARAVGMVDDAGNRVPQRKVGN